MYIKWDKIIFAISILLITFSANSCRLFDKQLEQDRHIATYRQDMLKSLDSLSNAKDRIASFEDILERITNDNALITPRKKNELIKTCYSFISNEYCELQDYAKAIDYSNTYIKLDDKDARGYFNRGVAYQGIGDEELALSDYLTAIALNEKYTPAYYNSGIIYENMAEYDKALDHYTKAIKLRPSYLRDVYINRGNVYEGLNNLTQALDDYSSAIEVDSTDITAYCNRGNIHTNLEEYDKAILDYTKALAIDSISADAHNKRAYALELKKDYSRSLADYRKALTLDPDNSQGQRAIATLGITRSMHKEKK